MPLKTLNFGKRSGLKVSPASIGAMRLPEDYDESVAIIRRAIDSGMRYIDTSLGYGESELKLAKALKGGYREKVLLSTKWAPWILKKEDDDDASADCVLKRIEMSIKRLDVDYLDFYQVWNVQNSDNWKEATKKGGFVDGIKKAMNMGIVKHTGFTSHEKPELLINYLDEAEWAEVLLVSYNMINKSYKKVLEKAKSLGIGTIVMNPVAGGKLTTSSPVFEPFVKESGSKNLSEMAIRYVLANENVDTIISGITSESVVDDVVKAAEMTALSKEMVEKIDAAVYALEPENTKFCTRCNYCMPCPSSVNIPHIMEAVYYDKFLKLNAAAKEVYNMIGRMPWLKESKKADACTECGVCEEKCTQGISIIEEIRSAHERLNEG